MIHAQDRKRRPQRRRTAPSRPPLLEPVEPRLLLCVLHTDGGAGFNMTLWGGDPVGLVGPTVTATSSAPTPTVVGPPANLQAAATADLFSPITWGTQPNGMPILNSLPAAPTAIYLDFDGQGTETPYSEDADTATFNPTEQANIVEAWRHISAYFAMFNTNVTTVATSLPKVWNVIGNNSGGATGGYAYVGTFPNSSPQAFNTSSNARTRQSGMAHEIGHVFGLQHQSAYDLLGNKTAEYLSAPDSLHGPIMGVDYSGTIHKWFIGHSATSPGTLQDDIAVIANKIKAREPAGSGGDGFRPDDFPNTIAAAAPLADDGAGLQYASGIVERMADVDAFSFTATGGVLSVAAVPELPSGLDARLEIYDSSGNRVATKDGATNDQQLTLALPAGTYYALVSSHGDYGDLGKYDLSVRALPAGWLAADVGSTGVPGYTAYDPTTDTFTNAGAGPDITGTTDQFHFTYQALRGDGQLIARLTQNQNTGTAARAGLDIRDALTENARHAAVVLTPAGAAELIYRTSTGGSATTSTGTAASLPRWLRMVRTGNTLTGYTSPDGVAWTQVGPAVSISMGTTAYVGLTTTAGSSSKLNLARFDSVSIAGDTAVTPPAYNALPAPTNLAVAPAPTGTGLSLAWDDVPGATGFVIERSADGVTYTTAGSVAAGVTTYADTAPTTWGRYFYRVSARDGSGNSLPSDPASAVNRAGPIATPSITAWKTDTLVVNWKDVSGDTGYRVERSIDGGATFTPIATVGTNVPAYTDSGLATGTTYVYRVVTLSPAGDSAPSVNATGGTRLPAVTGAAIDSVTPTSVTLRWTDLGSETGYRIERSTNGTTWTTAANIAGNLTTYTDTGRTPLNKYYYRVFGTSGSSVSLNPTAIYTATPSARALPAPWTAADIGTKYGGGGTGASDYTGSTFTIISGGNDIWGSADSFRYTYQPLVGAGEIVARVASIEDTDPSAKVGLMIRSTLQANSVNVFATLTRSAGVQLQYRPTVGASTTAATTAGIAAPYWLKLRRDLTATPGVYALTGYYSPDGVTWTQLGTTQNLTMPSSVFVGIAATSHDTTTLMTSTVTNVTLSNNAPTVATSAAASPNPLTGGNQVTLSALGADDHGESNLVYTWAATATPDGAPAPTFDVNGVNAARTAVATLYAPGDYQFTVTITDTAGLSVTSTVSVTAAPSAFPAVTAAGYDFRRSLTFTFNTDVSIGLSPDDLQVQPLPAGGSASLTPDTVTWNPTDKTATFAFNSPLPDGDYRATLTAAGFATPTGAHMPADDPYDFFVLVGDINRDRAVNFGDLLILSQNYNQAGKTYADGDLDGDGTVNFSDLLSLAKAYNKSLPSAPEPFTAVTAAPTVAPATLATTAGAAATPTDRAKSLANLFNTKAPVHPTPPPKPLKLAKKAPSPSRHA